jgi:hypothetical protein
MEKDPNSLAWSPPADFGSRTEPVDPFADMDNEFLGGGSGASRALKAAEMTPSSQVTKAAVDINGKLGMPTVGTVLNDPAVSRLVSSFREHLDYAEVERWAFVIREADGTLSLDVHVSSDVGHSYPGNAPDNAVMFIHTHPDIAPGMRGGPMSYDDFSYQQRSGIHMVALDRGFLYYISASSPGAQRWLPWPH